MMVMWTMNVVFVTDFPTKEIQCKLNVVSNNSYNIFGENFVKTKKPKQNKINSASFQDFASCKSLNLTLC